MRPTLVLFAMIWSFGHGGFFARAFGMPAPDLTFATGIGIALTSLLTIGMGLVAAFLRDGD